MGAHEYERTKPMIWAMFMHAALPGTQNNAAKAAERADACINEFERRFPAKPDNF